MKKNPKRVSDRIERVLVAWQSIRPNETFAGLTLAQFRALAEASLEPRARIAELKSRLRAAAAERDQADLRLVETMHRIVATVQAHPDEGRNGALYRALGYVTDHQRKSGLKRRRRTTAALPRAAA
jgi:hypothetical protein